MNRRNGLYSRRDKNNKLIYWAAFAGLIILVYSFIGGALENDIARVTKFDLYGTYMQLIFIEKKKLSKIDTCNTYKLKNEGNHRKSSMRSLITLLTISTITCTGFMMSDYLFLALRDIFLAVLNPEQKVSTDWQNRSYRITIPRLGTMKSYYMLSLFFDYLATYFISHNSRSILL